MFKNIFKNKFHLRFAFNPYIRYKSNMLGNAYCVTGIKRKVPLVISLTSYEERFSDLELTLYSLMNQSIDPDRIILYLSDKFNSLNDIPYSITKYIKNGLEIKFVKDIGPYTKIIYALKECSNSIIITADDDIVYPKDWLEKLYSSYIAHPDDVHVHRAHRVKLSGNTILPYKQWEKHILEESARYDNFLTGVGGVLYPPRCFYSEVYREDIFLKYAPTADDIWLWVMTLLSNRKIRVVNNHMKNLTCTDYLGQIGFLKKRTLFSVNKKGKNDKQMQDLIRLYGRNIIKLLKDNTQTF